MSAVRSVAVSWADVRTPGVGHRGGYPADLPPRPFTLMYVSADTARTERFARVGRHIGARRVVAQTDAAAALLTPHRTVSDVCIVDGGIPDVPVLSFVRQAHARGWLRVVLITSRHDILGIQAAMACGVRSYVVVERRAPVQLAGPARGMSAREIQVLQCVAEGLTNKQIGARLELSSLTVKSHLARIARKFGSGDRAHLVALGMRAGLIT